MDITNDECNIALACGDRLYTRLCPLLQELITDTTLTFPQTQTAMIHAMTLALAGGLTTLNKYQRPDSFCNVLADPALKAELIHQIVTIVEEHLHSLLTPDLPS